MATINLGAIKFNWKGAYNSGTAYAVDDVVSSGGSSYVCILASTGNATSNGTYWEQMSSAGTNGTDLSTTLTTQGDVLYRDGSGLQRLAKGTAGKALVMNSGATAPEWGTVAGGKVLQVLSATKTDTQGFTASNNYQGITGLSLAITPSATSSKILITSVVNAHMADYVGGISIFRGGSQIANHSDSLGSRINVNSSTRSAENDVLVNLSLNYLDSPSSTSALTYQIYLYTRSGTYYVNRSSNDTNNNDHARTISTITAMEIGA